MCVCIRLSKFGASLSDLFNVKEGGSKQGRSHTHTASERQASEGVGSEERRVCACVCVCERERECIDPGKEGGREGRWEGCSGCLYSTNPPEDGREGIVGTQARA